MARLLLGLVVALIGYALVGKMGPTSNASPASIAADANLSRWKLDAAETVGYNSCMNALRSKTLRNNGPKSVFCACYIREGAGDLRDGHKARAGEVIGQIADLAVGHQRGMNFIAADRIESQLRRIISPASTRGLVDGTIRDLLFATKQCIETAGDYAPRRR